MGIVLHFRNQPRKSIKFIRSILNRKICGKPCRPFSSGKITNGFPGIERSYFFFFRKNFPNLFSVFLNMVFIRTKNCKEVDNISRIYFFYILPYFTFKFKMSKVNIQALSSFFYNGLHRRVRFKIDIWFHFLFIFSSRVYNNKFI